MTQPTDIVERLDFCAEYGLFAAAEAGMDASYAEAAAEITRLRTELAEAELRGVKAGLDEAEVRIVRAGLGEISETEGA